MAYYDIAVVPVPQAKLADYKKMLKKGAAAWKRCGALSYVETLGDGLKPGKQTSFLQSVKAKKGETVGVAILTFKNKTHRNQVWKKMMKDPFMSGFDPKAVPFDARRMYFGAFKPIAGF
ncbi:MAG: DUF1428 domain-containing protein [Alphaproteobacteria bacterium]|nr:DUF1428 domain-containing protein [Alphaproteobacteria bacterium]